MRFLRPKTARVLVALVCGGLGAACDETPTAVVEPSLEGVSGAGQSAVVGAMLAEPLVVRVRDAAGAPVAGQTVAWRAAPGGIAPASSPTDADGLARATVTLGPAAGTQTFVARLGSDSVTFAAIARPDAPTALAIRGGTGQAGRIGQPLGAPYVVEARDRFGNPVPGAEIAWQAASGEGTIIPAGTTGPGVTAFFLLADGTGRSAVVHTPERVGPNSVRAVVGTNQATVIFTSTGTNTPTLVATVPIPPSYGIHDTFVRDGIAFVSAWNTGLILYDVGNGIAGGSPAQPAEISRIVTGSAGLSGARVHNAWWFHNPVTAERRYVFVGQEGPGIIGSSSSGDIHVVDVTNLAQPVEVAFYHLNGAGTHNFWMDEPAQILYAAYYNGGVVALDVSGTLSGDLAPREIARTTPGGATTYVWGVQLSGGALYATDMLHGLYRLALTGGAFAVSGGDNVPERYSSDLWVHGTYAYTGTWGTRAAAGHALKIWQLPAVGVPTLVDSLIVAGIGTVSDVEVSADGRLLLFSAENGPAAGIHLYDVATNPARPQLVAAIPVSTGVHTATLADIGGRRYVFAARNPSDPALRIYDVTGLP
ncbi:MAG: Ig-like domain-containing protein [Gemmatimonadota bacterium]|nr:Ig-like domain-containing protein [Gemmatimonadota bacterium]